MATKDDSKCGIASFNDMKELINMINSMETFDDVDKVYNHFVSSGKFDNDYNARQLENLLYNCYRRNYKKEKLFNKLISKFMEKYPLYALMMFNYIKLPSNCIFEFTTPEGETIAADKGITIDCVQPNSLVEISKDDEVIFTITILDNDYYSNYTKNYYNVITFNNIQHCINFRGLLFSISFGNIDELMFYEHNRVDDLNDIEKAIMNDDIEAIRVYAATNDIKTRQFKSIFPFVFTNQCWANYQTYSLIELAMLYNAKECFKFLYLNKCLTCISANNIFMLLNSGNYEMFHICENEGLMTDYLDILIKIAEYTNDIELFCYWYNKYYNKDSYTHDKNNNMIYYIINSFNYNAFEFLLDDGFIDFQFKDNNDSLLKYNFEAIQLLTPSFSIYKNAFINARTVAQVKYMIDLGLEIKDVDIINSTIPRLPIQIFDYVINILYPNGLDEDIRYKIMGEVLYQMSYSIGDEQSITYLNYINAVELINKYYTNFDDIENSLQKEIDILDNVNIKNTDEYYKLTKRIDKSHELFNSISVLLYQTFVPTTNIRCINMKVIRYLLENGIKPKKEWLNSFYKKYEKNITSKRRTSDNCKAKDIQLLLDEYYNE